MKPLNLDYIPNLKNVWPALQSPYYDQHSRYTVPTRSTRPASRSARTSVKEDTRLTTPTRTTSSGTPTSTPGKVALLSTSSARRSRWRSSAAQSRTSTPRTRSSINRAEKDLAELTRSATSRWRRERLHHLPSGKTWHLPGVVGRHRWGASTTCRRGSSRRCWATGARTAHAATQNDMIMILRGAKNPVLAHAFLNFMLDNKVGIRELLLERLHPAVQRDRAG